MFPSDVIWSTTDANSTAIKCFLHASRLALLWIHYEYIMYYFSCVIFVEFAIANVSLLRSDCTAEAIAIRRIFAENCVSTSTVQKFAFGSERSRERSCEVFIPETRLCSCQLYISVRVCVCVCLYVWVCVYVWNVKELGHGLNWRSRAHVAVAGCQEVRYPIFLMHWILRYTSAAANGEC